MRPTSFRLLLPALGLLAGACDDSVTPLEPPVDPPSSAEIPAALAGSARWAAGYLHAGAPTAASYAPVPYLSYNASGGAMNITKPAGTTGRYIVTFTGLSAVLGTKSTVHVTEYGLDDTYCKPVNGRLVNDKLEVRCFRSSTRAPANAAFTVVVIARASHAAFAYAHLPTSTGYAPASAGSYNPGGGIRVYRYGVGEYRVVFTGLALTVTSKHHGHAQVNAVGTGKAHCTAEDWGTAGSPDVQMWVACYAPNGAPLDSKFTALFQLQHDQVAYAYASDPTGASYSPMPERAWNPTGGPVTITRQGVGDYTVIWSGVDGNIVDGGTVHVTSAALYHPQCKATSLLSDGVKVHCFAPNGAPTDAEFTVLLGS